MPISNLDFNLLPVFRVLMEEQHLSRAAERLNLSQPAVSAALKRLRFHTDDALFVRTARGLKPTPRAIALYTKIRDGLELIEQGWQQLHQFDPCADQHHFLIATNPAVEFITTPQLMHHLRQEAPGVHLTFEADHQPDIVQRLQDGRTDLAIDFVEHSHSGLVCEPLHQETLVVIAAKNHPRLTQGLTASLFSDLDHVTIAPRNQHGTPIEQLLGHKNLKRNICLALTSFVAVPRVVANTDLIAVVPVRMIRTSGLENQLQSFPLPFSCPEVTLQLIWHESRNRDQAHEWLRNRFKMLVDAVKSIANHPDAAETSA